MNLAGDHLTLSPVRRLPALLPVLLLVTACAGGRTIADAGPGSIDGDDYANELSLLALALAEPDVIEVDDVAERTVPAQISTSQLGIWIDGGLVADHLESEGLEIGPDELNAANEFITTGILGRGDAQLGERRRAALDDDLARHVEEWARRSAAQSVITDQITQEALANEGLTDPDTPEPLVCLAVLVAETSEAVEQAVDRLEDGEDFASVAAEVSIDPSGQTGGDLGCLPESLVIPELGPVTEGALLEPVEVPPGVWVLYSVPNVAFPDDPDFADAAERVPPGAAEAAAEASVGAVDAVAQLEYDALLAELRSDADVSVDPRIGSWDPEVGLIGPDGPVGSAFAAFDG